MAVSEWICSREQYVQHNSKGPHVGRGSIVGLRHDHFGAYKRGTSFAIGKKRGCRVHQLRTIEICKNNLPCSLLEEEFAKSQITDDDAMFVAVVDRRDNRMKYDFRIGLSESLLRFRKRV